MLRHSLIDTAVQSSYSERLDAKQSIGSWCALNFIFIGIFIGKAPLQNPWKNDGKIWVRPISPSRHRDGAVPATRQRLKGVIEHLKRKEHQALLERASGGEIQTHIYGVYIYLYKQYIIIIQ